MHVHVTCAAFSRWAHIRFVDSDAQSYLLTCANNPCYCLECNALPFNHNIDDSSFGDAMSSAMLHITYLCSGKR